MNLEDHMKKLDSVLELLSRLKIELMDTPNTYHETKQIEQVQEAIQGKRDYLELLQKFHAFNE